jgi:hypothetical protein
VIFYVAQEIAEYFEIIFSSKWQKAVEVIGNKCEAKVPDLVEGMKYQFRVRAVNKGGQSKPSDPSDTITAKDRFGESHIPSSTCILWVQGI